MFPGAPGWSEMLIIGVIALLLFGKRLPEVARSLGQGLTEFKKGMTGAEQEFRNAMNSPPPAQKNLDTNDEPEFEEEPEAPAFEAEDNADDSESQNG